MLRRSVLAHSLALGVWTIARPLAVRAQQARRAHRIGVLSLAAFEGTTLAEVMAQGLARRGYVVGQNIDIEDRFADGKADRLPGLATELVALKVDLVVAGSATAIRAARDATTTVPIVMAFSGEDPVKSGFVASLGRPGGNVTGVTAVARDMAPKSLEMLRYAVPALNRVAVLANPARTEHAEYLRMVQASLPPGVQLQVAQASGPLQYDAAFASMSQAHAQGLVIFGDVVFTRDAGRLAELARLHALPSVYLHRAFAVAGGLMTYGPDLRQLLDLATEYIDRILQGADPGTLPVQQPTRFKLAVNARTARALGLTIPPALAQRVDEVIQ
ncbi:ABC transporter substrate-binding protein [Variovorax sp. OV329]|uniref:ABC transporter substrate-binding protein n=1 Tax=Variovorax sp. OV329 TaxID=1882825 RepID=UPI0008DEEBE1|nr:ABC transporter substrate-binding protein [Variovorax sp. OV329]SFM04548.1 putative ABC transport system substrate-binding protein [Variovorax sp. OV329]